MVKALLRWYSHNLKKHQFAMNMVTTGTVFFVGDILSQQVVAQKGKQHDTERTFRSVVIGTFYSAPGATFLHNLVDRVFGPSRSPKIAIKKLGMLSLITPINILGYVILNNLLQSKSTDFIIHQIRNDVPTMIVAGYSLALPTQFILLTVVPLKHRVLLGNFVRVLWTVYLTHTSNIGTGRGNLKQNIGEKK
ncbi:hypothetical protein ACHWQZ_G007978 [Mnemiopsis leidyi]